MAPLLTLALALAASLSVAGGQDHSVARSQLPFMTGTVKEVSASSVTFDVGGNTITFKIDAETSVTVKGATHAGDLVYRPNRRRTLSDFVKVGDRAAVRYRQADDVLIAVELLLTRK